MDKFVGFIHYTKVKMKQPDGPSHKERCVYSEQKLIKCLNFQKMTKPDDLVFLKCMARKKDVGIIISQLFVRVDGMKDFKKRF